MKRVLVVDDEVGTRQSLKAVFSGKYDVCLADGAAKAREALGARPVDLILLDVSMPGKDGLSFLKDLQELYPEIPVVMISALTSVRPVVEAMREGAYDFVAKPFDVQDILRIARRAIESSRTQRRLATLETEVSRQFPVNDIIGSAPSFLHAMEDLRRAADSDSTVLILGESGTGKELAARLLHETGGRREEPFVPVHCAALPEALMESELFGHEKGAYTGAEARKPGRFDLAGAGTLFFDEVGEMSLATQVKLLRVLQEREFMRVGGTSTIRTNARIVAATARDLKEEVRKGKFRDDLFYRLSVVPVRLPPLRERREDVAPLALHFLETVRRTLGAATEAFAPEALEALTRYAWPGNVRELSNIVERMVVLHRGQAAIRLQDLPEEFQAEAGAGGVAPGAQPASPEGRTLEEAVSAFERRLIEQALRETNGVQTRAAEKLGTTRRILRYRMQKLAIDPGGYGADADEPASGGSG